MPDKKISHLLIDTSYLRTAGFNHPDFRRLLHFTKLDLLKIYIPHIAWEERRTQFLEVVLNKISKVTDAFDRLKSEMSGNFVLDGLPPPTLNIWSKFDVNAKSKKVMVDFATDNKIVIVPPAHDHADRAWERYFNVAPPFNPAVVEREKRRKDIPDSWIFEVAIDLHGKYPGLLALCDDGGLSDAMQSHGIHVFKEASQVIDEIDRSPTAEISVKAITTQDSVSVSIQEKSTTDVPETALELALEKARGQFKDLDMKILGYVGYLGAPSKDQLFTLLSKSGIPVETAKNVTERLVIAGILADTGNHYLSRNKVASDMAANLVEPEIIQRLEEM